SMYSRGRPRPLRNGLLPTPSQPPPLMNSRGLHTAPVFTFIRRLHRSFQGRGRGGSGRGRGAAANTTDPNMNGTRERHLLTVEPCEFVRDDEGQLF
ncbi:hypothetical protein PMAYCL1PPCAC_21161, partial [Pristionchus mayeri]